MFWIRYCFQPRKVQEKDKVKKDGEELVIDEPVERLDGCVYEMTWGEL